MKIRKEWFLAKELVNIPGFPTTSQGVNKRARLENWKKRAVAVPGARGRSFEYHIDNFPVEIQAVLKNIEFPSKNQSLTSYEYEWLALFRTLSEEEQVSLLHILRRKGIEWLITHH
ncbi:DNA-binding protein [Morganella morganii]|nr:DNA-binding protein [Morganella morganii]EMD0828609.1 DNA-binding protein [Morganella morganii]